MMTKRHPVMWQLLLVSMFLPVSCTSCRETRAVQSLPTVPMPEIITLPTSTQLLATTAVASAAVTPARADFREGLTPGLYLAYWSQSAWYIREINASRSLPLLPGTKSAYYTEMEISPDGTQIAFLSAAGRVSVYNFRTGDLATYPNPSVSDSYDFTWLPARDLLLYLGTPEETWYPDADVGLYGISLSTGTTFRVLDWTDRRFRYGLHDLRLSPDAQWLSFSAARRTEMSPDPNYAVYLVHTSCLEKPDTCIESMIPFATGDYPVWSPDGRLWWVCSQETHSALCVGEPSAAESSKVFLTVKDLVKFPDAGIYDLCWSPDGAYAAVGIEQYKSENPDGERAEIFLIRADGSMPIQVTTATNQNEYIEGWAPDSRYLVYSYFVGYTDHLGELGTEFPITDLYLYDVETRTKRDFIDTPGDREVFEFFMSVK